jgi:hypothetical protein
MRSRSDRTFHRARHLSCRHDPSRFIFNLFRLYDIEVVRVSLGYCLCKIINIFTTTTVIQSPLLHIGCRTAGLPPTFCSSGVMPLRLILFPTSSTRSTISIMKRRPWDTLRPGRVTGSTVADNRQYICIVAARWTASRIDEPWAQTPSDRNDTQQEHLCLHELISWRRHCLAPRQ